jgi:hypothetical protein
MAWKNWGDHPVAVLVLLVAVLTLSGLISFGVIVLLTSVTFTPVDVQDAK